MKEKPSIVQQEFQAYNQTVNTYNQSGYIPVEDNCFAYMFTNLGDTDATVNGMLIHASATPATDLGDSRSVMAHKNDLYKGRILLQFAAGGVNPLVEIVQLFYIKIKE